MRDSIRESPLSPLGSVQALSDWWRDGRKDETEEGRNEEAWSMEAGHAAGRGRGMKKNEEGRAITSTGSVEIQSRKVSDVEKYLQNHISQRS